MTKIRFRSALVALAFLFSLGSGIAVAGSGSACAKACSMEQAACVSDAVGSGKTMCAAQYKVCKASCDA